MLKQVSIIWFGLWGSVLGGQGLGAVEMVNDAVATTYTDSFATDQALIDASDHSPCWPQTANAAVEAHLRYRRQQGDRVLDFIGGGHQAAYLAYQFPLPGSPRSGTPMAGTCSITVGKRANVSAATDSMVILYYATSYDDRQWSEPQGLTAGEHTFSVSSPTGILNLLFWSQGAWIDDLHVNLKPRTAALHVPGDYTTIQAALNAAQDGDIIQVAAGVYSGVGNTDLDCLGKAVTLRALAGPDQTIIRCGDSRQQRGFYFHQGETRNCVIQGFTIEDGRALLGSLPQSSTQLVAPQSVPMGGGVYCLDSSPTLINCVIRSCQAVLGGGLAVVKGQPQLIDCRIEACQAVPTPSQDSGWAGAGAALLYSRNTLLLGCTLQNNRIGGLGLGAGLYLQSGSQRLLHCIVRNNRCANSGGGLYAHGQGLQVTLQQCLIVQNTSASGAGLVFEGQNDTTLDQAPVIVQNCTIADNLLTTNATITSGGNGVTAQGVPLIVENSIIWNSQPSLYVTDPQRSQILYSLIQGGWTGTAILDTDPLFNAQDANDYHLQSQAGRYNPKNRQWDVDDYQSPAIDAGNLRHSVALEPSPNGNRINLGAYGGYRQASMSRPATIFHVDGHYGSDTNSGLSRDQALATIQTAIDRSQQGDRVLVWPGLYQEALDFKGRAIIVEGVDGVPILTAPDNDIALSFYHAETPQTLVRHMIIAYSRYAVYCNNASPRLEHLTLVDNDYGITSYEGGKPVIRNSILWNNRYSDLFQCQAAYSCVQRGATGLGNISADPWFADPDSGDYHLMSTQGCYEPTTESWVTDAVDSPCINAGDPNDPVEAEPSPNGNRVNMGAYGRTAQASQGFRSAGQGTVPMDKRPETNPVAVTPVQSSIQAAAGETAQTGPAHVNRVSQADTASGLILVQ